MATTRTFTAVDPTQTASTAGVYIPPFATNKGSEGLATSTGLAHNPNPTTPSFLDDSQWAVSYLTIHKMSISSYRYMYLFWIAVTLFTFGAALLHWTGSRGGVVGAAWSRFGLRRRTWRKKHSLKQAQREGKPHKQPDSFAPNAQILILTLLFIVTVAMSVVGPDYISPDTAIWDLAHNLTKRAVPLASTATTRQPDYTIPKAWWTAGGRTGLTAFALIPLCVLFSLKAPPFALFALSFLTQIHFDKLARFHRWSGRLIWLITTIHIALWGVQLGKDPRGGGTTKIAWDVVWTYAPFIYGCIGYVCLTAVIILSLSPLRTRYYEAFYVLHVIFVALTLVFSGLHFPTIGWWAWGALILWGMERSYRAVHWAYINGYIFAPPATRNLRINHDTSYASGKAENWEMGVRKQDPSGDAPPSFERGPSYYEAQHMRDTWGSADTGGSTTDLVGGGRYATPATPGSRAAMIPRPLPLGGHNLPPPGWAHATLLPGRTVRLKLLTPRPVKWAPGQHILLRVPCVSKYTTHPFTIASVCDNETPDGHMIELLVRARSGFTLKLWDTVLRLSSGSEYLREKGDSSERPKKGAFIKADVDGPFGSSVRARWGANSTLIIITGGSGVSFGASILEYVCLCISGRDGKELGSLPGGWGHGGFQTTRVRFIWLVREYSHIQWCAAIIRRCVQMVPSSTLQVDIFVSNFNHKRVPSALSWNEHRQSEVLDDVFVPPTPHFVRQTRERAGSNASVESRGSLDSEMIGTHANPSYVDLDYSHGGRTPSGSTTFDHQLGHEEHVLDLTNFDGEEDTGTAAEMQLSLRVKKEGKLRRANTRRKTMASAAKDDLKRVADARYGEPQSPPKGAHDPFAVPGKRMSLARGPVTSADTYRHPPNHEALAPYDPRYGQQQQQYYQNQQQQQYYQNQQPQQYYQNQPYSTEPNSGVRLVSPPSAGPPTAWSTYPMRDEFSPAASGHHSNNSGPRSPKRFSQISMDRGVSPSPSGHFDDAMSFTGADSVRRLVSPSPTPGQQAHMHGAGGGGGGAGGGHHGGGGPGQSQGPADEVLLNMDDEELEDLNFVSEMARPGKPKLDRIIVDEVERSRGAVAVACCGPTSLNAVVRKIVAAQISPSRIMAGDMRGAINLTTEEFEW